MLKVYLKGFDRPYAVFGCKLFEDERFFVIVNNNIQSRILWENILYIESVSISDNGTEEATNNNNTTTDQPIKSVVAPVEQDAIKPTMPTLADVAEDRIFSVIFSGFKDKTFSVAIPSTVNTDKYSPQIATLVFSDPQVRSFLGDFVIKGVPQISGQNIIIETGPTQANSEKINDMKDKIDIAADFLTKISAQASKHHKPSMGLDTSFSMMGSPFSTPVRLQDDE